jgi:hypothetical protein
MTPRAVGIVSAQMKAGQLLSKFGVEEPDHLHVEGFAARLGVGLMESPLDGASAQLIVGKRGASIVLSDRLTDPGERRFAIAHELGHFVLQHPAPPAAELCAPRPRSGLAYGRDIEEEADRFASYLLMPPEIVRMICDRSPMTLEVPALLARMCRVSIAAGAIRITESTFRLCAAVLSLRREVRWVAPSVRFLLRFGQSLTHGKRIDPRSLAWQFFERGTMASRPQLVPAAAWLDTSADDALIQEHSIAIAETETVLTMLWLPSDQAPPCSPSPLPRVDSLPAARRPETSLRVAHRLRAEAFGVMRQTRSG